MFSGMQIMSFSPITAQTIASPIPVFPLVGSIITVSLVISPLSNAHLIIEYEALSFIEQNFQRDVSIEEIAAFCGLNRSYFSKLFRDTMGESPQAFLLHYRMARAAEMLKETVLPIGTISSMVSYANQLHFSRAFKSVYGVAPRTYRQTHFIRKDG